MLGLKININSLVWGIVIFIYTFLLVYVGRFEEFTSYVTKGITPILLLITIGCFRNPIGKFPKEYFTYIALFVWAGLSIIKVNNFSYYYRFMQLFLGITMLLTIVFTLLPRHNIFYYFHIAFILGTSLLLVDAFINYDLQQIILQEAQGVRLEGQTGAANTIGAILLLGSLSLVFVYDFAKSLIIKLLSILLLIAFVAGIVATASRSSTLCVTLAVSLYIIGKLILKKQYLIIVVTGFLLISLLSIGYDFILENTFMGYRIQRLEKGKDGSAINRKELIFDGFEMIKKNPFIGVGLGNFTNNSRSGNFAHNDIIELTATTGSIGLCIYLLLFIQVLIRLRNLIRINLSKSDRTKLMTIQISIFIYLISGLFKPLFIDLIFIFYFGVLIAETQRLKYKYAHLSDYKYA